jgi:D-alanyl-D-alanine carboxypeptidase
LKRVIFLFAACSAVLACEKSDPPTGEERRVVEELSSESRSPDQNGDHPRTFHPLFTITPAGLEELTSGLPGDIQTGILTHPEEFLELFLEVDALPEEYLWLVDKQNSLPEGYEPDDLVYLRDYKGLALNRDDLMLRETVMTDLLRMVSDAREEGITLLLSSTYRSYDYQEKVFAYHVERIGREAAERESAFPGKSQHQLGTTIDFGSITAEFAYTEAGKWLAENSWKYGFSLSYPDGYEELTGYIFEPWHFRYISPPAARFEQRFFGGIQQYMLTFLHEKGEELKSYFVQ